LIASTTLPMIASFHFTTLISLVSFRGKEKQGQAILSSTFFYTFYISDWISKGTSARLTSSSHFLKGKKEYPCKQGFGIFTFHVYL